MYSLPSLKKKKKKKKKAKKKEGSPSKTIRIGN